MTGSASWRLCRGARLIALGVAVAAASAVPAVSNASASAVRSSVPWSQAGPGWSLVQYSTAKQSGNVLKGGTTALYLVDPRGQKFTVHSWKNSQATPIPHLLDWSGDRQRALLVQQVSPTGGAHVEQISLVTDKVVNEFTLPSLTEPIGYTKPDGLNLLTIKFTYNGTRVQLIRYNLAGVRQRVLAEITRPFADTLYAPDGTYLLATAPSGLDQISNTGGVVKRFHPRPAQDFCSPIRWWNSTTVLASCFRTPLDSVARLWLFHVRTGRSSPLAPVTGFNQNTAWYISSGQFLQESTICPVLAQVFRNGSIHKAPVPGNGSIQIVGAVGGRLLLTGQATQCYYSASASLLWFDPKQHKVSYLLRAAKNVIGVLAVVPFGGSLVVS